MAVISGGVTILESNPSPRSATCSEGDTITKEALFYYIYGLLHSPDYRSRYADNLGKELPRIPAVKTFEDFRAFSQAGRDLAHWHLNYETVALHPGVTLDTGKTSAKALTDAGIDHLIKLKNLKQLDVVNTNLTDAGVARLRAALPNCDLRAGKVNQVRR